MYYCSTTCHYCDILFLLNVIIILVVKYLCFIHKILGAIVLKKSKLGVDIILKQKLNFDNFLKLQFFIDVVHNHIFALPYMELVIFI